MLINPDTNTVNLVAQARAFDALHTGADDLNDDPSDDAVPFISCPACGRRTYTAANGCDSEKCGWTRSKEVRADYGDADMDDALDLFVD